MQNQTESEHGPVVPVRKNQLMAPTLAEARGSSSSRSLCDSVVSEDFVTMEKEQKPLQRKYSITKMSSFAKPADESSAKKTKKDKSKKKRKQPKNKESSSSCFSADYCPRTLPMEPDKPETIREEQEEAENRLSDFNPYNSQINKSKPDDSCSSDGFSSKHSSFQSSLDLTKKVGGVGYCKPESEYEQFERSYRQQE